MTAPTNAKREFTMPAEGTPEFDALKARWTDKPVTFGQCNRLKSLFSQVQAQGGYAGKVPAKTAKVWDKLTERSEDRRWVNLRSDKLGSKMTMWDAHLLMDQLAALTSGEAEVTVSHTDPKPAPAKAETASDLAVLEDGQLVMVKIGGKLETKRVNVVGNRVTLGRI